MSEDAARLGVDSALPEGRSPHLSLTAVEDRPKLSSEQSESGENGTSGTGSSGAGSSGAGSPETPRPRGAAEAPLEQVAPVPPTVPEGIPVRSASDGMTSPVRVFSRIARLGSARSTGSPLLEPLLRTVRSAHPKADLTLIEKAFEVASRAHSG